MRWFRDVGGWARVIAGMAVLDVLAGIGWMTQLGNSPPAWFVWAVPPLAAATLVTLSALGGFAGTIAGGP